MKIITICNYRSNSNIEMLCRWWLDSMIRHSNLPIEIWYEDQLKIRYITKYENARLLKVKKKRKNINELLKHLYIDEKASHNIGFKLYNLCNESEPFIFVDMDAIIMKNIDPLIKASTQKPVIMINHQRIRGHTEHIITNFLNSGVQIVSDPKMLDFDRIIELQCEQSDYIVPGYDQALLFNYFTKIEYDYTHGSIGHEWNNAPLSGMPTHDISINHYWFDMKPWIINCPLWNDYKKNLKRR